MTDDIVTHYERELESAKAIGCTDEEIKKMTAFLYLVKGIVEIYGNVDNDFIASLFVYFDKYVSSQVFFPLTLKEGEFRYEKPGVSVDRRNNSVIWVEDGIYYDRAFKVVVDNAYDSFTSEILSLEGRNLYKYVDGPVPIYIRFGKHVTNNFITRAYIRQHLINKEYFLPRTPVSLHVTALVYKRDYIYTIGTNDSRFSALMNFYRLNYQADNDSYLKNFGVTDKIPIDVIRAKERSSFRL